MDDADPLTERLRLSPGERVRVIDRAIVDHEHVIPWSQPIGVLLAAEVADQVADDGRLVPGRNYDRDPGMATCHRRAVSRTPSAHHAPAEPGKVGDVQDRKRDGSLEDPCRDG